MEAQVRSTWSLPTAIAFSRHSYVLFTRCLDASSTLPTKYVSFRSPAKFGEELNTVSDYTVMMMVLQTIAKRSSWIYRDNRPGKLTHQHSLCHHLPGVCKTKTKALGNNFRCGGYTLSANHVHKKQSDFFATKATRRPKKSHLESGMPWQITSLTDLRRRFSIN